MDIDGLPTAEFAFPGPLRDTLVAAILRGDKTATTSLHAEYERLGEPLPRTGRYAVLDSAGARVAVIEVTDVQVLPLGAVGDDLARAEGEGFATAAQWRAAHERFWSSPQYVAEVGEVAINDDTPVVVEHLHLVDAV